MKSTTTLVLTLLIVILASCSQTPPIETTPETTPETPSETNSETTTEINSSQPEKITLFETSAIQNNAETLLPSVQITDGNYTLDPASSTLTYTASRVVGTPHVGTVALSSGTITLAGQTTQGTVHIDMTTITESKDNQRFLTHLKSKDFFDVENYPEARMNINSIKHTNQNEYSVNGDLTILNITQPISFPATLTPDGKTLRANANFTIDRTRWNITYDSGSIFSELGDRAIKDEIGFTLDLTFSAP